MTMAKSFGVISALYWLLGMHFFMHNPGGSGLYLPFNAWGWIFTSLVMGLGLWQVTLCQQLVVSPLQIGLWLGGMLLLLPMAYPGFELKDYAIPRLLGLFAGLLFLSCLYQWRWDRQARDKLLYLLLGAVAIEAILGLVQFYLLTPGNWIGYDTHANRPYGIFQQPNVMASFMATGLSLAIWLEIQDHTSTWLKGLRYGVILAASVLLVVLQSRVGQLGGLLVLVLLVPQLYRQHKLLSVFSLVVMGIALGLISQYWVSGTSRGVDEYLSGGARSDIWPFSLNLLRQHWLFGVGYGGYEPIFFHSYAEARHLNPNIGMPIYNLDHPHNEFLYWAVEGGIAAMLGILAMIAALLWRLAKAGWVKGLALLALVTPILLHTQTEYPFYHAIALWWALLLLIYVLDAEVEEGMQARGNTSWREYVYRPWLLLRFMAIGIPLIVVPFMLTAIHTAWVVTKYERGGYKQPTLLLDVINPMAWLTRVEFDVNAVRLMVGLQTNNKTELEAYLEWGQGFVRHTPRANIYANMVIALHALGRQEEAERVRKQALVLYPGEPLLTGSAAKSVAATLERKPSS
ncbi:PglL family O-oligosaccharyltransferase [Aeromonas tecta]|uniref:PglL family O-oligosaccharyltransferase n=1 Tax=Aeromonas tecta TaxID=324617 RepID=UPI0009F99124|nr:Wzy polymerase domain-containing protein [Aeromonas tecta]